MSTTNSPITSPTKPTTAAPETPGGLRQRNGNDSSSTGTVHDTSPSNSTLSDFTTNATGLRLGGDSRAALRNLTGVSSRNVVIRADPTILTCFDPADKELYDLWAPKH